MRFSRAEVVEILRRMRDGASVRIGSSRAHATYTCRDGAWVIDDFDEGHVQTFPTTRETVRRLIRSQPSEFLEVLLQPRWARFTAAFLDGDPARALAHLEEARPYDPDTASLDILEAFLWFPARRPSRRVVRKIRAWFRDFTAYHLFMEAAGWDRSPEAGEKGVAFVDRLIAMAGEAPGCFLVRAAFHDQAGDAAASAADHVTERERAR